ncbi:MAG: hypothetical protein GY814_19465, partial [Gammaproteobacteria bacterium]|nr:hypothetical protein [Gammaproteobacteria bacterium]
MGKHNSGGAYPPVNQGIWPVPFSENSFRIGRGTNNSTGVSSTDQAFVMVNGVLINLYGIRRTDPDFNPMAVLLPPAPDGLDKRDGSGRYDTLADAIAAGGTSLSQSVINRQDLVLLEVWHEKVSHKDVVYPRGLVQYYLGQWEGLGLSTTYVDQGYSAMFEGDTSTTGKSRRWSTSSPAEQAKFIQDPLNNIYSDNGELIQVRARARVIRGLEGSWSAGVNGVSPVGSELYNLNTGAGYVALPQGALTEPADLQTASNDRYMSSGAGAAFIDEDTKSVGAFSMRTANAA